MRGWWDLDGKEWGEDGDGVGGVRFWLGKS